VRQRESGAEPPEPLIGGLNAVYAELATGRVQRLWVDAERRDGRLAELLELASSQGVPVERVARKVLDQRLPGVRHQGVVAQGAAVPMRSEAELPNLIAETAEPPLLLVLDQVQDPHNLGACLRSAVGFGVQAVIVPRDRAVRVTPVVRKVASGAAERIPLVMVTNLARTLRSLREAGVRVVGAAGDARQEIWSADLGGPLALVMGGEQKGLRRLTRECCDQLVRIPMTGLVESLNVAAATAVCLFEARRQRTGLVG
jgi:23S rRNA (guanosine2251-2'-O)-methyltransferase